MLEIGVTTLLAYDLLNSVPAGLATGKAVNDSTNGLVVGLVSLKGAWVKGTLSLLAGEAVSVREASSATMA